jgi:predicted phage tail protein
MDKQIQKDLLRDNCDAIEEKSYMRRYTPEELQDMKDSLSQQAIDINVIEEEKEEVMSQFKARLKPIKKQFSKTLKGIKEKAEYVSEECFKFVDQNERMVGFYNNEGDLIEARPANADELQGTIFQMKRKTGTNN